MSYICTSTQEAIAWGRVLSESSRIHLLECARCSSLTADLSVLDASLTDHFGLTTSPDFADRVMLKISESQSMTSPLDQVGQWIVSLFSVPSFEIGLASAGGIFAFFNILRFVLGIIVPVSA